MNLNVVGSGSSGNCYILTDSRGQHLILEAGLRFERILKALNFDLRCVDGLLISHGHRDHSMSAEKFKTWGIPVIDDPEAMVNIASTDFGRWHIKTFPLQHDVPCMGFYIKHPELPGAFVYVTDTAYVKYRFTSVNTFLVECNHEDDIDEITDAYVHIVRGHMDVSTCRNFLKASADDSTKNVIMCHMSEENLNWANALRAIEEAVPQAAVGLALAGRVFDLGGNDDSQRVDFGGKDDPQ